MKAPSPHPIHNESIQRSLALLIRGATKAYCQVTLHVLTGAAALHIADACRQMYN